MCIQKPIGATGLYASQQVMMTIRESAGCKAGVTSGIVVQATKAGLLEISRHDTRALVLVPPSDVTPLPLQAAPSDTVMRARLDGVEEAATVVRVDSPTSSASFRRATTGRIIVLSRTDICVTYTSLSYRVRSLKPKDGTNAAALALCLSASRDELLSTIPAAVMLKPAAGDAFILSLIKSKFPTLKNVVLNPHAADGRPLHTRFKDAVLKAGDTHMIDVFVHGTAGGSVSSILTHSLNTTTCYFTRCVNTAASYASQRGGAHVVVFAVLHEKAYAAQTIVTTSRGGWHLPLASAQVSSPY